MLFRLFFLALFLASAAPYNRPTDRLAQSVSPDIAKLVGMPEKIREAQISAIQRIQEGSPPDTERLRFLDDSGLYEIFSRSLGD